MNKDDLKAALTPILSELLAGSEPRRGPVVISAAEVTAARGEGVLEVPADAIVTPLARDTAGRFGITIIQGGVASPVANPSAGGSPVSRHETPRSPSPMEVGGRIAIGSDHGGFKLKERLKARLATRGRLEVVDCGTLDGSSCDYPDLALAVARAVALGEAEWGLLIDGAGIGSCMAANKVPGVLAANCHSPATARNAREHNGANVLCLGSGHLDADRAGEILEAFLATPFGGGRHGRRVAKIRAIEQAFTRTDASSAAAFGEGR